MHIKTHPLHPLNLQSFADGFNNGKMPDSLRLSSRGANVGSSKLNCFLNQVLQLPSPCKCENACACAKPCLFVYRTGGGDQPKLHVTFAVSPLVSSRGFNILIYARTGFHCQNVFHNVFHLRAKIIISRLNANLIDSTPLTP